MQFKMGEIISLNETNNTITVRDNYSQVIIPDLPLDNIRQEQIMPVIGDTVLYLRIDDRVFKVVKIWNVKTDGLIRREEYPLKEGELQLMSLMGQYIYFDREGTIRFVDSTMINLFELSVTGLMAKMKSWSLTTYDGVNVIFDKDILITRDKENAKTPLAEGEKPDPTKQEFSLLINDDGIKLTRKEVEINIDVNNQVTIKGSKIILGSGILGDIVTGGPTGTMPMCFVTGAPIIGSSTCKAQG